MKRLVICADQRVPLADAFRAGFNNAVADAARDVLFSALEAGAVVDTIALTFRREDSVLVVAAVGNPPPPVLEPEVRT